MFSLLLIFTSTLLTFILMATRFACVSSRGKGKDCVYLYLQAAGGAEPWCAVVSSSHHEGVLGSLPPTQGGSRFQLSSHRVKGEAFCSGTYNQISKVKVGFKVLNKWMETSRPETDTAFETCN